MEDYTNLWDIGILEPDTRDFFTAKQTKKYDCKDGCIVQYTFQMSLTTESYTRNVYTVLMFLSDVGGLYGILLPLGSMIVSMVSAFVGSGLERFVAG